MNMRDWALVGAFVAVALSGCSTHRASTSGVNRVESIVRQYFSHLEAFDYDAMRAMATADAEMLDTGYRLNHVQFEKYIQDSCQARNCKLKFEFSNFNTRITSDVAYTSYEQVSPLEPALRLLGLATLRRSGGDWRIDQLVVMMQAATKLPPASGPDGQ